MKHLVFRTTFLYSQLSKITKTRQLSSLVQRAYSTQSLSMDLVVKNFYQKNMEQGEEQLTLSSVIKTMSEVIKSDISFNEHHQYQPIADELAHYVERLTQSAKKPFIAPFQVKVLLDFGTIFGINSREYWKFVQSSFSNTIETIQISEIMASLTQLRHLGLLSNNIIKKAVTILKDQLPKATPQDLTLFTMIYTSQDVQSALIERDRNFEDKLEYYLTKLIDQKIMLPSEFALVCNSISFTDTHIHQEDPIFFDTFLTSSVNQVQEWIKANDFSINDLGYVIHAYSLHQNLDSDIKSRLYGDFELLILNNCQQLNLKNAVDLVQAMCQYASKELLEVFDRIIGKNIYDLPLQELLPTIKAFQSSQHSRDKIFMVLFSHVKRNIPKLSLQEQCQIPYLLTFFKDESFTDLYDMLEPFIIQKLHEINENELLMLINGYYNQNLTKRFEILNILEAMILKKTDALSISTISQALYFYSKNRLGERVIVESLIQRLNREDQDNIQQIDAQNLIMAVLSLNMAGADQQVITKYKEAIIKNLDQYSKQELSLINEVIPVENREFDDLRKAISVKL